MGVIRPNNDIIAMVADIDTQLREIKEAQRVGSDVVKLFRNRTTNTYDYSLERALVGGSGDIVWKKVRFTPDKVTDSKMTSGAFKFIVELLYAGGLTYIDNLIFKERVWQSSPSPIQEWWVGISSSANSGDDIAKDGLQLKFHVYATGKGTITIV